MKELTVSIEMGGRQKTIGSISGCSDVKMRALLIQGDSSASWL